MKDTRAILVCAVCSNEFKIKQSRLAAGRGKFCSSACKRSAGYAGKSCAVDECERPAWNRNWCRMHYARWFRAGSVDGRPRESKDVTERFWEKVNSDGPVPAERPDLGPCWLWVGAVNNTGYGTFWDGERTVVAHVFAYEWELGPIPEGLEPDHLCRVRHCVRPSHLDPVTHGENVRRGMAGAKNREKTHCKWGHPFDAENTYVAPGGTKRACRVCRADWSPTQRSVEVGLSR